MDKDVLMADFFLLHQETLLEREGSNGQMVALLHFNLFSSFYLTLLLLSHLIAFIQFLNILLLSRDLLFSLLQKRGGGSFLVTFTFFLLIFKMCS